LVGVYPDAKVEAGDTRKRRRHALPIARSVSVYEWVVMLLLSCSVLFGVLFFGASRIWAIGPLSALVYLGMALFIARALFWKEYHALLIPPGGVLLLVFWVFLFVRIPFSSIPYLARLDWLQVGTVIFAYFAWTELATKFRRWKIWLAVLVFGTSLLCWYAIIAHAQGWNTVVFWPRPDQYGGRVSGTYLCPNHFAHLLEIIVCICIGLLFMPSVGFPMRMLAGYTLLLSLPPMFLSQSRSGWIGLIVGSCVTIFLAISRRNLKKALGVVFILLLVFIVLILVLWFASDMFQTRLAGMSEETRDGAVAIRLKMWSDSVPMIKERWLLGFGGGSFRWVYLHYKTHLNQLWCRYAHNEYVHGMVEYGVVGMILLMGAFIWGIGRFLRVFRRLDSDRDAMLVAVSMGAVAASLVHATFDFNFHVYANNHVLAMLGGITAASLYASGVFVSRPVKRWAAYPGAVIGTVIMLILMLMCLQFFSSYLLFQWGERARVSLAYDQAQKYYQKAIDIDQENWQPWLGMADVSKLKAFWNVNEEDKAVQADQALIFFDEAYNRNPYDMVILMGKSKVQAAMGNSEESLELLQYAVDYEPSDLFYASQLGLELRRLGKYEEALIVFEKASKIGKNDIISLNIPYLRRKIASEAEKMSSDAEKTQVVGEK